MTWLDAAADRAGERAAVQGSGATLTYTELDRGARTGAAALTARGVRPGDRVALALESSSDFAIALHACLHAGAVAMPIDVRLRSAERDLQTQSATVLVERPLDGPEGGGRLQAPADHRPGDVATVVHSSGTTARPHAVELTYGNWEASARASAERLGEEAGAVWLCALPVSHVGGLSILVRAAIAAATVVLHPRFEAGAVAAELARNRVTGISLVPTMLARLLDAGARPGPALRCVLVGGGPLAADLADRAASAGWPLVHTYGLTEACSQVTTSEVGAPGTAGLPLPGTTVEIAADGEILVAGPTVAPACLAPDGWLHTGDLGELDETGRLTVTGRAADMIVTGGENVAPAEVEAALETHPDVVEAAAHGRADREWGEAVCAVVVAADGSAVTAEQLRDHCSTRLASFKVPKAIRITADRLPRTPSGKLRRSELG